MSSNDTIPKTGTDIVLSAENISKTYLLYDRPSDRLRQMIINMFRRALKRPIAKLHNEVEALRPISFSLRRGETIAIIGLNGAGKSTLLQLIAGTVTPTTGSIEIAGNIAALLELGSGFEPSLTGRQNVMFGGMVLGMKKEEIEEKYDAIEAFADIGKFIDYPVNTYSTGMYVRLAFALAIHSNPEIFIVDEALSVGDFMFQQKCNRYIKENLDDTTKLLVTHDFGAVTNLADSVIVLHRGEMVFWGDPQAAIEKYQIISRGNVKGLEDIADGDAEDDVEKQMHAVPIDWQEIEPDRLSGTRRAVFSCFNVSVNGSSFMDTCANGDNVKVSFKIDSNENLDDVVLGYQIQDRFGNVVFGNNTLGSGLSLIDLKAGEQEYVMEFTWPLVAEGKYGLTLGIGLGQDALHHEIACWAHNIYMLQSAPTESLHGIFNVNIETLVPVNPN